MSESSITVKYNNNHFKLYIALGMSWLLLPVVIPGGFGLGVGAGILGFYIAYIWFVKTNDLGERYSYLMSMLLILIPFDMLSVFVSSLSEEFNFMHLIGDLAFGLMFLIWLNPRKKQTGE